MSATEALNAVVAVLAIATLTLAVLLYASTRAPALLVLVFAFVWGAGIRVGILTGWDFIVDHSAQLQVGTWLLWFLSIAGLMSALRHFNHLDAYKREQSAIAEEFDRQVEQERGARPWH